MDEKEKWNKVVKSFSNWDIYYLQEYASAFQIHGDGNPLLIDYSDCDSHFCYVVMKSDIAESIKFQGVLKEGEYYDLETPYGYGGPLSEKVITEESQKRFLLEFRDYSINNGIVSQFVRFHPLLKNYEAVSHIFDTRYLHDTIYIDTESEDDIVNNMDSKNRNMVRKAKKNGVTIQRRSIANYQDFLTIYTETMERDNAEKYYYFNEEYFKAQLQMEKNTCIFYACVDGVPVAAAIMYYNDNFMHYHLAGTKAEYRKLAPSNLLLYEAACWACKRGIKLFHLGGGMVQEDSLFGFKKQFNRNGRLPFVIGRTILDEKKYMELMNVRREIDNGFDLNNSRMIQYRA